MTEVVCGGEKEEEGGRRGRGRERRVTICSSTSD